MRQLEIWPGPLEGIGQAAFVRSVNSLGLTDRWMTPFFRLSTALPRLKKLQEFAEPFLESELPVCVQLMGTDAQLLGEAAHAFLELGAQSINLNFGCPSKRVCSSGTGGGSLQHPEALAPFCLAVKQQMPQNSCLSVKLRTGCRDAAEMRKFLPELAACQAVSKIFLHYRTVKEMYSPDVLPYRFERLLEAATLCHDVPLVINGDIDSAECAAGLVSQIPCAGIMIARPWLRDPFLLRRITSPYKQPSPEEGREIFFAEAQKQQVAQGTLKELAKLLWGTKDEHFTALLR